MSKIRWWAMHLTSLAVGYLLGVVLALSEGMFMSRAQGDLVRRTAREHAEAAALKQGPYLAPVTFVLGLAGATVLGALLIRWVS